MLNVQTIYIVLILNILTLVGCGPKTSKSSTRDLAANKNAKNVALIFGAENDLPGVERDVIEVSKLFSNPDFGFQVVTKDRARKADFINESSRVAASLDADSTLFWYYSGHGSDDGSLVSHGEEESVYLSEVIAAMKSVRKTPFKRLIVVMDSCFSGQNVDGQSAILTGVQGQQAVNNSANNMQYSMNQANADGNRPFEQGLIIGAARANEMSQDFGDEMGGAFTYSWRTTIAKMLTQKTGTIRDMLNATVAATRSNSDGEHTPVFRASPDSILNEPLMGPGSGNNTIPSVFRSFLALVGSNEATPNLQVSVPQNSGVSSVLMCRTELAVCRQSGVQAPDLAFIATPNTAAVDRAFFTTQFPMQFQAGNIYSLIFKNAAGLEVGSKTIRVPSN